MPQRAQRGSLQPPIARALHAQVPPGASRPPSWSPLWDSELCPQLTAPLRDPGAAGAMGLPCTGSWLWGTAVRLGRAHCRCESRAPGHTDRAGEGLSWGSENPETQERLRKVKRITCPAESLASYCIILYLETIIYIIYYF